MADYCCQLAFGVEAGLVPVFRFNEVNGGLYERVDHQFLVVLCDFVSKLMAFTLCTRICRQDFY